MRKVRSLIILISILISTNAFAQICGDVVFLKIVGSGGCGVDGKLSDYNKPLDPSCTIDITSDTCIMTVFTVCCPIDIITDYEDDSHISTTITNVPVGTENEAARTFFESWSDGYKQAQPDFSLTGYLEGFAWSTQAAAVPGTVNVKVSAWKRGYFTKDGQGTITPIETIGGTQAEYTYTGGTFDPSVNSGILFTPSERHEVNLGTTISNAYIAFQNTSLGGLLTNFNSIPSSWGGTAFAFDGGVYGQHEFDLAKYSNIWAIIGSILIIVCSWVAITKIFKGGGG